MVRAAASAGAKLVDTSSVDGFAEVLERETQVSLVVMTRLAVTYEIMPVEQIQRVVRLAHDRGVPVYVDDAGGARVGPALFEQPRTLQLGVDLAATGLDKYGTVGPRLGVMAGEKSLVARIRARAYEMGLEARPFLYPAAFRSLAGSTPERVQQLAETARAVAAAVRAVVGAGRLHETPVICRARVGEIGRIELRNAELVAPEAAAASVAAQTTTTATSFIKVGAVGFEPTASWSQTKHSNQAELRPARVRRS